MVPTHGSVTDQKLSAKRLLLYHIPYAILSRNEPGGLLSSS